MRRAEQEREHCGHAVYRNGCAVCVKGRCVEKHRQIELLKEEESEALITFSRQENADTFPILIRRDDGHSSYVL